MTETAVELTAVELKRKEMSQGLYELAQAVLDPKFPLPGDVNLTIDANVWGHLDGDGKEIPTYGHPYQILPEKSLATLRRMVRGLGGGRKEKHYGTGGFTCKRMFGSHVSVTIAASRDTVCRKVSTGNKIMHASSYTPAYEEEEYEWVCEETLLGANYHGGGES